MIEKSFQYHFRTGKYFPVPVDILTWIQSHTSPKSAYEKTMDQYKNG